METTEIEVQARPASASLSPPPPLPTDSSALEANSNGEPSGSGTHANSDEQSTSNHAADPPSAKGYTSIPETLSSITSTPHDGHRPMSITESIRQAPNPRPADFSMLPLSNDDTEPAANDGDDAQPGSPTSRMMRAIAPPNATVPDVKWPAPPQNASVNLFIGRALLADGNDNWPLKPNDIVNYIRRHYPTEWDGDEGRCSAHRVRTYLARKGADMYYEKLSQGNIAGWRIRQNHLWRFENGGFLGRGMKQEEAIAQAHKESEALATAAHKAAAAEALAAGHPGVKVSMSQPGINDGIPPPAKKSKLKAAGQARRRNTGKLYKVESSMGGIGVGIPSSTPTPGASNAEHQQHQHQQSLADINLANTAEGDSSFFQPSSHDHFTFPTDSTNDHSHESEHQHHLPDQNGVDIDPNLIVPQHQQLEEPTPMDIQMVQQAMQAAAAANQGLNSSSAQMDELEMGMQLPIEMQMHGEDADDSSTYRRDYGFDPTAHDGKGGDGQVDQNYINHQSFGFSGQVYGHTGYQGVNDPA